MKNPAQNHLQVQHAVVGHQEATGQREAGVDCMLEGAGREMGQIPKGRQEEQGAGAGTVEK